MERNEEKVERTDENMERNEEKVERNEENMERTGENMERTEKKVERKKGTALQQEIIAFCSDWKLTSEIADYVKSLSPCCTDLETLVNGILYSIQIANRRQR